MDIKNKVFYTTITEECKNNFGNKDGFYDGKWRITDLNYRKESVELSNGRVSILKKFNEINDITVE